MKRAKLHKSQRHGHGDEVAVRERRSAQGHAPKKHEEDPHAPYPGQGGSDRSTPPRRSRVIAFFTLQLALGGWLATQESVASHLRWSLLIIDLTIALILSKLLFNNHRRRQEVADTIKNVNKGLGFDEAGAYLDKEPLNPPYKRRYWVRWYVAAV